MPPPTNTKVHRSYHPAWKVLSELSAPLCTLFSVNQAWFWGQDQDKAFDQLKTELITPHILRVYDL